MSDPYPIPGTYFPCGQCGSSLRFSPGTKKLVCPHCGYENPIADPAEPIRESDFHQALEKLSLAPGKSATPQIQCHTCGARFRLRKSLHAGHCPFCGSPVIIATARLRPIPPRSLLPFSIDRSAARQAFRKWLKSLWFAPSALKRFAREEGLLSGLYLPYWTFDSHTETSYRGARGILYYETRPVTVIENGRPVRRLQQVQKIRWHPVRGRVSRFFDDVLVGASHTIPRQILDRLGPWDLENLVPYNEKYLSGFESEVYQTELAQGFEQARRVMDRIIDQDIRFDIGCDLQQIHRKRTRHLHTTFKHCLLPVWIAAYRYRNRSYRVVINGRSGKVQGQRPYSYLKILVAVVAAVAVVSGTGYVAYKSGLVRNMQTQTDNGMYGRYPELAK